LEQHPACKDKKRTVALILAGYDKPDILTRLKRRRELRQSYDGEIIYMGHNKFLEKIRSKPVIEYVISAVNEAKVNGKPIYDKIYIYNDIESVKKTISADKYQRLELRQMTGSVGGNWKDFYNNEINYGDRVDVFFGDTPRITPEDVEWIHRSYSGILGKKKDHRGVTVKLAFGIVRFQDLHDDCLNYRHRYIKRGKNKGKLKYFVGFENYQARVGNSGAMIKDPGMDEIIDKEVLNFFYNLRKALTPSVFSKIIYYLMKTKNFDLIKQVKNRKIKEKDFINSLFDIAGSVYNIDISRFAGALFITTKNAAHWENDIDTPTDLKKISNHLTRQGRNFTEGE
jgi:hypothetical protein